MKKILSMVLMICIILTSLVMPSAVMADSTVNVAISEGFEGSENLLFAEAAGITVPTDNAYGINKYISFELGTYRGLKTENIIPVGDLDTTFSNIGANAYAEYEFDIKPSGQAAFSLGQHKGEKEGIEDWNMFTLNVDAYGNLSLTARKQLADTDNSGNTTNIEDFQPFKSVNGQTVNSTNESGLIGREGNTVIGVGTADKDKWNRIKIVTRVTNNNKAAVVQIKQVYVNGIPKINDSNTYFFREWTMHRVTRFDQIELTVSSGTFGLDNFTASVYNSADGKSPIVEKGALLKAIRNQYSFNETFENFSNSLFDTATETDINTYGINKYVNFVYSTSNTLNGKTIANPVPLNEYNTSFSNIGANAYAEYEFDVKTNSNSYVDLGKNENNDIFNLHFDGEGNIKITTRKKADETNIESITSKGIESITKENKEEITVGSYTPHQWHRIKIVTRINNVNNAAVSQIKQVYVDGVPGIPSNDTNFYFFGEWYAGRAKEFNQITLRSFWENCYIALDNFTVTAYNSADGTSPIADKGALISAIRKNYNTYNEVKDENGTYADTVKTIWNDSVAVYNNVYATPSDVTAQVTKLNSLATMPKIMLDENFEGGTNTIFDAKYGEVVNDTAYGIGSKFHSTEVLNYNFSKPFGKTYILNGNEGADCKLVTEFDVKTPDLMSVDGTMEIGLASSYTSGNPQIFSRLTFRDSKIYLQGSRVTSTFEYVEKELSDFYDNRWYHIAIVQNVTNAGSTASKQISEIYINGVQCLDTATDFQSYNDTKVPYYDTLVIINEKESSGILLDNITVKKNSTFINRGALLSAVRNVEKYNAAEGADALIAAKAVIENAGSDQSAYDTAYAGIKDYVKVITMAAPKKLYTSDYETDGTTPSKSVYGLGNKVKAISGNTTIASFDAVKPEYEFMYADLTFDVLAKTNGSIMLKDANGKIFEKLTLNSDGIKLEKTNFRLSKFDANKWYRIKLVALLTEGDMVPVFKIVNAYIDGIDMIEAGKEITTDADLFSSLAADGNLELDNVDFTLYCGSKGIPDEGYIISSLRKGDEKMSRAVVGTNVSQEILDAYTSAYNTAKTAYEGATEATDLFVINDALCEAYSKFVFKDEAIEIKDIGFEGDSFNTSLNKVVITRKADYGINGYVVAGSYSDGKLYDKAVTASATNLVDGDNEISLSLDIPTEGNEIIVRVMFWNNLADIAPITKDFKIKKDDGTTVYVCGDSIVQTYTASFYPQQGWGSKLEAAFNNSRVVVNNQAMSGRTVRMFIDDGRLNTIEETITDGDYVLISFMANDQKTNESRGVELEDYKNYLRHYADVIYSYGATPIFVTSTTRVDDTLMDYGKYPDAMAEVAAEYGISVIDLFGKSRAEAEKDLEAVRKDIYLCYCTAEGKDFSKDFTHLSEQGSVTVAGWVIDLLKGTNSTLKHFAK